MTEAGWAAYAEAITGLHRERELIAREGSAAGTDRAAALGRLSGQLAAQRDRLEELGQLLRAGPTQADLTATAATLPPGADVAARTGWERGTAELSGWLSRADDAAEQARRIGGRPQLLPGWSSPLARHAVVYALVVLPNALFTIELSLLGVTGSEPLLWWFGLIFPVLAAIGGGVLVGRLCAPRISPASLDGPGPEPPEAPGTPGSAGPHAAPRRRHRWLAIPFAWASWLVPGFTLDLIAPQLH
ncbi:MAG TPA: hypothetical protein VHN80_28955, partial [Kineosporiaceae bacterium]|nr:hypothetical protein [Kineosporiaceae bacterium]